MKKTKKLMISENCFRLLFESDDDYNPEEKVKGLLASGIEENIEMAFTFMDSLNLDKKSILQPFRETYDFLQKHGKLSIRTPFEVADTIHYMSTQLEELDISRKKIKKIPKLNLPNLKKLNISENSVKLFPDLSYIHNLKFLYAVNNRLTSIPFIPSLVRLFVGHNLFSRDEIKNIEVMYGHIDLSVF
jgi:Leucine-rich repeat (LRR) protein